MNQTFGCAFRLTLVKPTYKWRGGGGNRGRGGGDGGRAPKYKRETSRGDEMRRKVKDSNQAKRQSAAVAVAPQTKPDTSKLQRRYSHILNNSDKDTTKVRQEKMSYRVFFYWSWIDVGYLFTQFCFYFFITLVSRYYQN